MSSSYNQHVCNPGYELDHLRNDPLIVRTARWILLLILTVAVFYWKIAFTKQFSILWQWEPVNQSYSWYHFAASQIHRGVLPIWDPYRFSGSTFIGEMQTGLFYPLKLLAYIMPFDRNGMLSERVYNEVYVLTHMLAAIFMFLLGRQLRLSSFSSLVAGLSFALGGYIGNTGHPHTLDSAIWLPLIVLFFLRSIEESAADRRSAFFAALAGLGLGMAVLGGGLDVVIMAAIVIATMSLVEYAVNRRLVRIVAIAAGVAVTGFLFGAVQLLPSFEYAPSALRWVGSNLPIRSLEKVPYQDFGVLARFSPRSLFTFLFATASAGDFTPTNYFGVLPLFLSIIGAWRSWRERWVKYFVVLGVVSFVYTWGEFSLLHGLLYLLPGLDLAREAGRFIHLTHFAMAILAGYGIEYLFRMRASNDDSIWTFVRAVRWLMILVAAVLIAGSLQTTIAIADRSFLSLVFISSAYVLLELVCRNHRSGLIKFCLVFILLWDLYAFNWMIRNKRDARAENQDFMEELLSSRKLAEFFQSRGSIFRVHFDTEFPPNIGNVYGIPMTGGMSATMLGSYWRFLGHLKMPQLLNVRYTIRRSDTGHEERPVFSEGVWRVYENSGLGDRAWVVHRILIDSSTEGTMKILDDPEFDPGRVAILEHAPVEPIDAESEPQAGLVTINQMTATSIEFRVQTRGRGLLVASEIFYPGWQAYVNGRPVPIYRVDGLLRGVAVPDGNSVVRFDYRPLSVRLGFILSLIAVAGTGILGLAQNKR